jgi:hypothetical protein
LVYIYIKKGIVISSDGNLYEGPIIHPNLRHGIGGFHLKKDRSWYYGGYLNDKR